MKEPSRSDTFVPLPLAGEGRTTGGAGGGVRGPSEGE
jgi:hypothetical protein